MTGKLASITVDLDEVGCYGAIHGVDIPDHARHTVYDSCVPRLARFLEEASIPATFFAIGSDLERDRNQATIRHLHESGHEVANHSYTHQYDLSRQPAEVVRADIERGATAIETACGRRPAGFRAPGYTITDDMFAALEEIGVLYDSSVFPCPSYYALKVSALAWIALRGRQSKSIVDTPSVVRAPKQPYRIGRPYWRRGSGMIELPIGVTPWGLPFIGTSLALTRGRTAKWLTRRMLGFDWIHIELHGFDAADLELDKLHALAPHRADLRRSADEKLSTFREVAAILDAHGYEWATLEQYATRTFSASPNR